eukprot:CAMPEP_0181354756 /NCGR_PEP_ID=MMETSP1106-20121128/3531_1 /TAXON_ID=81844 /ORGANISM="Mantoniella antarctica, Strain SL-175" /LENGTH=1439 /DNA_ID=CAMNT_0023467441 /DNA_START=213 /DNA_END=4532 /DNA_ORIENTATION=-
MARGIKHQGEGGRKGSPPADEVSRGAGSGLSSSGVWGSIDDAPATQRARDMELREREERENKEGQGLPAVGEQSSGTCDETLERLRQQAALTRLSDDDPERQLYRDGALLRVSEEGGGHGGAASPAGPRDKSRPQKPGETHEMVNNATAKKETRVVTGAGTGTGIEVGAGVGIEYNIEDLMEKLAKLRERPNAMNRASTSAGADNPDYEAAAEATISISETTMLAVELGSGAKDGGKTDVCSRAVQVESNNNGGTDGGGDSKDCNKNDSSIKDATQQDQTADKKGCNALVLEERKDRQSMKRHWKAQLGSNPTEIPQLLEEHDLKCKAATKAANQLLYEDDQAQQRKKLKEEIVGAKKAKGEAKERKNRESLAVATKQEVARRTAEVKATKEAAAIDAAASVAAKVAKTAADMASHDQLLAERGAHLEQAKDAREIEEAEIKFAELARLERAAETDGKAAAAATFKTEANVMGDRGGVGRCVVSRRGDCLRSDVKTGPAGGEQQYGTATDVVDQQSGKSSSSSFKARPVGSQDALPSQAAVVASAAVMPTPGSVTDSVTPYMFSPGTPPKAHPPGDRGDAAATIAAAAAIATAASIAAAAAGTNTLPHPSISSSEQPISDLFCTPFCERVHPPSTGGQNACDVEDRALQQQTQQMQPASEYYQPHEAPSAPWMAAPPAAYMDAVATWVRAHSAAGVGVEREEIPGDGVGDAARASEAGTQSALTLHTPPSSCHQLAPGGMSQKCNLTVPAPKGYPPGPGYPPPNHDPRLATVEQTHGSGSGGSGGGGKVAESVADDSNLVGGGSGSGSGGASFGAPAPGRPLVKKRNGAAVADKERLHIRSNTKEATNGCMDGKMGGGSRSRGKELSQAAEQTRYKGNDNVSNSSMTTGGSFNTVESAKSEEAKAATRGSVVDEAGLGVAHTRAALEASMRGTKQDPSYAATPGHNQPQASSIDRFQAATCAVSSEGVEGDNLQSGVGFHNVTGENNCFMHAVVQSLWHLHSFSRALQAAIPPAVAGDAINNADMAVAVALCEVFAALDRTTTAAVITAGTGNVHRRVYHEAAPNVRASRVTGKGRGKGKRGRGRGGESPSSNHDDAPAPAFNLALTRLRKAAATLKGAEELFCEREMADASEAMEAILQAVHRVAIPHEGSKYWGAITPTPLPPDDPACLDLQSSSTASRFLDQECGYYSVVHRCFGLDVEESMECTACHRRTSTLRYTKLFHLLPATALNLAMATEGVSTMEAAIKNIDGIDKKSCDMDHGGCGVMNSTMHALVVSGNGGGNHGSFDGVSGHCDSGAGSETGSGPGRGSACGSGGTARAPPAIFRLALTWESAEAQPEVIQETMGNISTSLDLADVYQRVPAGSNTRYKLRSVMYYTGKHYGAFADCETAAGGERWVLFDDNHVKEVGKWEAVVLSCRMGKKQICTLLYQQEGADVE